jgi:hypothetical protein
MADELRGVDEGYTTAVEPVGRERAPSVNQAGTGAAAAGYGHAGMSGITTQTAKSEEAANAPRRCLPHLPSARCVCTASTIRVNSSAAKSHT